MGESMAVLPDEIYASFKVRPTRGNLLGYFNYGSGHSPSGHSPSGSGRNSPLPGHSLPDRGSGRTSPTAEGRTPASFSVGQLNGNHHPVYGPMEYLGIPVVWDRETSFEQEAMLTDLKNANSGQPVQQLSVVTALPDLLRDNNAECMRRVVPKVREVLYVAQPDMQAEACSSFLQILQNQLVPTSTYTQSFLSTILTSIDNRDPDIARAWLDTLLDVIDLLPKDVLKKDILPVAINKGQLSQSVHSRLCCCQILGKVVTKFEPFVIKKDILPVVQALCQDVEYDVRACMCRQLDAMAKGLGLEQTKSLILPELVELANDEEAPVRLAGLESIVNILNFVDNETCADTIIPLVLKLCQQSLNKEDSTLPIVSKQLGHLIHGMQANLSDDQKKWLIDFYKRLCRLGVRDSDRPSNRDAEAASASPSKSNTMQISDIEEDDHTVETRNSAAFNFPAMLMFVGAKNFKSELSSSFTSLTNDPSPHVRKTIASCMHEVGKLLGLNVFHIMNEIAELLRDDSLEVLQGIVAHLQETLECISKAILPSSPSAESKSTQFQELLMPILQCEAMVASCHNLRLHESFVESLGCMHKCYPSDLIYSKVMPVLLKKVTKGGPLPVKHAAVKSLLVLLRNNRRLDQRQDICHRLVSDLGKSLCCYKRYLYIDLCQTVMDLFSRAFFKEHFMLTLLDLSKDKVPNVRLRLCKLFPRLKKQVKLPVDRVILNQLETIIQKLLVDESDRDVKQVLEQAVKEFDRIPVPTESAAKRNASEEDLLDQKKHQFEKDLIDQEEKEKEEDAKCQRKNKMDASQANRKVVTSTPKKGAKAPPPNSSTQKNSMSTGGVTTERSGSFTAADKRPPVVVKGAPSKLPPNSKASEVSNQRISSGGPSSPSNNGTRKFSFPATSGANTSNFPRRSSLGGATEPPSRKNPPASRRKISSSIIGGPYDRKK